MWTRLLPVFELDDVGYWLASGLPDQQKAHPLASAFTKRMVLKQRVLLRDDPMNQNRDRYHRLLRHVFLEAGTLVNAEIIRQRYGFAYTKYPFSLMEDFRALEREAREEGRGLWAEEGE